MRSAIVSLAVLFLVAVPATALADTPDLSIVSIDPSPAAVPAGIPTKVTWTLNVRNNGDATTGKANTAIGPVGGGKTFKNVGMQAVAPSSCDAPGGAAPRCHSPFFQRPFTEVVTVTDIVRAKTVGSVTRNFTTEVLAPDVEGNPSDNDMSFTLPVTPGHPTRVSHVAVRPLGALSARLRKRAVGELLFGLNRRAEIKVTVAREADGRFLPWGEIRKSRGRGRNSILIGKRVTRTDYRGTINAKINAMRPGTYRLTIVATDAQGHKARPVTRTLIVPHHR